MNKSPSRKHMSHFCSIETQKAVKSLIQRWIKTISYDDENDSQRIAKCQTREDLVSECLDIFCICPSLQKKFIDGLEIVWIGENACIVGQPRTTEHDHYLSWDRLILEKLHGEANDC